MSPTERYKWYGFTGARALLSIFDLAGILAIGFVATSTAIFLTQGSSQNRIVEFAGLQIPAVTAQTLPMVASAILATFLLKAFLSIVITKNAAYFVAKVEAKAAEELARKVFGGDLAAVRRRSREEMAYAVQFGSPAAFSYLLNFTSTVAAEGALFVLICLGFLLVDPWSTLAAVVYFVIIAVVIQHFVGTLMSEAGAKSAKGTIEANGAVADLIAVFRELSVLGLRHKYINRIYQSRIAAAESSATQTYLSGMPRYIIEAALIVGVAAFILVQALTGDIVSSAATIGVFLSGGFRLTAAMLPLQSALLNIKGILPAATSVYGILREKSNGYSAAQGIGHRTSQGIDRTAPIPLRVTFRDVSFTYSGIDGFTLHGITFDIPAGKQVAFIGPSGSGKSTIADLICGVITPSSGVVEIRSMNGENGGEPVAPISYVPQKPGLVSGTVSQNVALGVDAEDIDEARVWDALESAHLTAVASSLPGGLESDLGNHLDSLSGGQIQRVGLARALYTKPGLLVMDEATSALDAESESKITYALNALRGEVTVVLIAHRLNTVQHADKVFLIDNGKLIDEGTFQELLQRNPAVERLVALMKVDE